MVYSLSKLLAKDDLKQDVEPHPLQKSGVNTKILFSAQLRVNTNVLSAILWIPYYSDYSTSEILCCRYYEKRRKKMYPISYSVRLFQMLRHHKRRIQ